MLLPPVSVKTKTKRRRSTCGAFDSSEISELLFDYTPINH